jgi:hypothetical protein
MLAGRVAGIAAVVTATVVLIPGAVSANEVDDGEVAEAGASPKGFKPRSSPGRPRV